MYVTSVAFVGSGICYFHLCDYKKAKEYCEKALKIMQTIGWKEKRIAAIECIGNVHQAMGEYANALRCYRQALKISKDIGQQHGITLLLIDIGSIFIEIGEFSRAKKYITDALSLATSIGAEKVKVECYKHLCRMSIMMKNYAIGYDFYRKGIRSAKELEMRRHLLEFYILASDMYYHEKKYMKGVKIADRTITIAKEIGIKDLYAHALLHKVKNGVKQAILIKIEAIKFLDEAKMIAEEIGCPELLWSVYYEYGRFLQDDMQHLRALDYYEKCNRILAEVSAQIRNESYKKNYLGRADRRLVDTAINEIARLHS
jgi:tetratricopeptide (TPR) repeat protein